MGQWTQRCSSQHLKLSQGHMWKRDVLPACLCALHCTALYICALTLKKYLRLEGPTQQCVKVVSGIKQWFTEVPTHTLWLCRGAGMKEMITGYDWWFWLWNGRWRHRTRQSEFIICGLFSSSIICGRSMTHRCRAGFCLCHYFVKFCLQIASQRNRIEKTKS